VAPRDKGRSRLDWLDVYRGIAIVAVVTIHVFGRFMQDCPPGSNRWGLLAVFHRGAHFAVPAFLLLSTALNASSLLRRPSLKHYALSRVCTVLWPYLLWSGIYLLYLWYLQPKSFRWADAPSLLLWGKAYHHLYFLWVLIQLLLILPTLVPLVRKRPPFWPLAAGAMLLTMGVYWLNRYGVKDPNLSRSVLWYLPVVITGLWLGSSLDELGNRARRFALPSALLAIAGFELYGPLSLRAQLGHPVNTFLYQMGEWLFTAAASVILLFVSLRLYGRGWPSRGLEVLGRWSLPIYLAHPLVFILLDQYPRYSRAGGLFPSIALYFSVALIVPVAAALILNKLRLYPLLFGRTAERRSNARRVAEVAGERPQTGHVAPSGEPSG
jgi:peptidoglycan/LPS O-acetylase OafA/YrhL